MKNNKSALDYAFHFLSFRSRSEQEMRDYLREKEALQVDETIKKLKELDLINDEKFIKEFVESRSKNKPKGKRALTIELKRKGISESMINDQCSIINEDELAKAALEKKKRIQNKEQAKRFLYSRGFSWPVIERTLKHWYNGSE